MAPRGRPKKKRLIEEESSEMEAPPATIVKKKPKRKTKKAPVDQVCVQGVFKYVRIVINISIPNLSCC
jgi:hypothetical protein